MLALRQDSGALTMNPRKLLAGKSLPKLFVSKMLQISKMLEIAFLIRIVLISFTYICKILPMSRAARNLRTR